MHFGITLKPDISVERIVGLTCQAESAGFEYGWIFDSHVLWKERYPLLTLMATNTQRMHLGLRHQSRDAGHDCNSESIRNAESDFWWTDGTRNRPRRQFATRVGKKPVSWSQLEASVKEFRDLTSGSEVLHDGQPTRLTWAKIPPRVWIAGYGPKVLHMAGRVADGIILQFADPALISWCMSFVKDGARAAGTGSQSDRSDGSRSGMGFRRSECWSRASAVVPGACVEPCHGFNTAIQA